MPAGYPRCKDPAERAWLPQFKDQCVRSTPTISIPPGVKPVAVPLDPALAVANRFGELMERKTT